MEQLNLSGWLTPAALSLDGLVSVVYFLLAFSLVIFVHELGHFAVAKLCGVKVLRFSIGMPPRLFGIQIGETDYCIGALPLGGYVKMLGQDDTGDGESPTGPGSAAAAADPRAFNNKSVGARAAILSAGVIMNLIFAFVLFIVIFRSGNFTGLSAEVGRLVPDGAAARLRDEGKPSLQPGDIITSVNGTTVSDYSEVRIELMLADPDPAVPINLTVQRNGETVPLTIPRYAGKFAKPTPPMIGFALATSLTVGDGGGAGLKAGETVVAAKGEGETAFTPIKTFVDLELAFARNAGKPLTLKVKASADAGGAEREAVVHPKVRAGDIGFFGGPPMTVAGLRPQLKITAVKSPSPAQEAGLQAGDIIRKIGGVSFPTSEQVSEVLTASEDKPIAFTVLRGESVLTVEVVPQAQSWERKSTIGIAFAPAAVERFVIGEVPAHAVLTDASLAGMSRAGVPDEIVRKLVPLKGSPAADRAKLKARVTGLLTADELKLHLDAIVAQAEVSRAAKAGLQAGDVISEFDGKPVRNWDDLARAVITSAPIKIERDALGRPATAAVPLTVAASGTTPERKLKIELLPREYELPFVSADIGAAWERKMVAIKADSNSEAVRMGLHKTWYMMKQVYATLKQMVTGRLGADNLSGPLGIVAVGSQVAQQNTIMMWYLLAAISVNLAVLNFLPIPVLDGGHIVFLMIEKVRGRPVPPHVADRVNFAGVVLLLTLFCFVTFNDVTKMFFK